MPGAVIPLPVARGHCHLHPFALVCARTISRGAPKVSKRASMVGMVAVAAALALTQVWPVAGQVTTTRPEDVGLSSDRFQRVNELMKRHFDAQSFSGAVTLVGRRGKVAHLQAHGLMELESRKAM